VIPGKAFCRGTSVELTFALIVSAIAVGSIHTLAPDHWFPFAALSRAERLSASGSEPEHHVERHA
jgi:hypothetical protein